MLLLIELLERDTIIADDVPTSAAHLVQLVDLIGGGVRAILPRLSKKGVIPRDVKE